MNVYGPNNDNQAVQFYDHLIDILRKESLAYEDKIIIMVATSVNPLLDINPLLDKKGWILLQGRKLLNALKKYKQHLICVMYGV